MARVNDIRSAFLNFFNGYDHEIVPSSPLVPRNDPTLMFVNAGMVQFKNVFTGAETRPYNRAVTSQKCVRAGGKHNDLDNVGYTARHHTFFEMLGNFSFGDYFKDVAIELAWELVTKEFGLDPKRLLVTVYSEDDYAADCWKKIAGLPDSKILRISTSDNFWAMGETGPCGPCSEIFFDHGEHIPGGPPGSPDEDGDRFIEIWNLVFMQYEQVTPDKRVDLPRPSIDTGMGLERIAAVLQGTHDNYEIDLFRTLIEASEEVTGASSKGERAVSHRVIADHLRATSFLIADGVLPSNEGRGYVLRRIMRRAMRHAHMLGAKEPVIYKLVPLLVREMGQAFPELHRAEALISETLKLEEGRFMRTLDRGMQLLGEESARLGEGDTLPGETAFKLYDTYGFPLDLTQDALKNRGIAVDTDGFNAAMERQKAEARKAWSGSGEAATDQLWFELRDEVGASEFLGYSAERAEGEITALIKNGKRVKQLRKGDSGVVITNQTPFYGEAGGQVGDRGQIRTAKGADFRVDDTQKKLGDLICHHGEVERGPLRVGDQVLLEVDHQRRAATRRSHSATHLLHQALRLVLGEHVAQKGSLVEPGRLRFDFSHPKPISGDDLRQIEDIANAIVLQNDAVTTRLMGVDEAIEQGALALFGEKYGEEVRVVAMGREEGEPCGQAVFHRAVRRHPRRAHRRYRPDRDRERKRGVGRCPAHRGADGRRGAVPPARARPRTARSRRFAQDIPGRDAHAHSSLVEERRKLSRELAEARKKLALAPGGRRCGDGAVREVGGVKLLGRTVEDIPAKELRGLVDAGKRQIGSGVVAIVGKGEDGKAGIVVGVTDDLTGDYDAVELVRAGAEALGGKGGGGRRDMAQAGGPDGSRAQAAIDAIAERLKQETVGA